MSIGKTHERAVVHPEAKVGKNVTIGPYAVIDSPDVVLADNVTIKPHAYITGHTTIGENTTIWPFASIGAQTQDLKYQGEITYVKIGKNCSIRESVTINSSCGEGSVVEIGDQCLIMAYCHIAHNCLVGNRVVMSNGATLAGHVTIGDFAILGGLSAFHQHSRIGAYSMVGGGSMVGQDLPPFCIGQGYPLLVAGLNLVGLKRNHFSLQDRKVLAEVFRITFQSDLSWLEAKEKILDLSTESPHVATWVRFCESSDRGLAKYRHKERALSPSESFVGAAYQG